MYLNIRAANGSSQGAGALVRRSIGSMNLRNLTPFLMLDHFHVSKGAVRYVSQRFKVYILKWLVQGFPDHPHRGQATVTYMLEGCDILRCSLRRINSLFFRSSRHEDSAGHKGTIVAGGVQWMTAVCYFPTSLVRNEANQVLFREEEVCIIQCFIQRRY